MNKEEEIADILSKEIAAEIDWEILSALLIDQGWKSIHLKKSNPDTKQWVSKNLKGRVRHRGKHWLIQREDEAAWFALRWV